MIVKRNSVSAHGRALMEGEHNSEIESSMQEMY